MTQIIVLQDAGAPSLITMEKNGEQLDVNPTCVQAHEAIGWKVVGDWKVIDVEADVVQEVAAE